MALRDVVRKVYNKLLVNNEGYLKYLRSRGVTIGEDVTFHCPGDTHVDITDPHLLTIGDHVNLTGPITILTHDYGWSVIKGKTGEILGNEKPVTIGNNVFVGWGATILCGTTIEAQVEEAKEYVQLFRARRGRDPKPEEIREYFPLFADPENLCGVHESQTRLMGTCDESLKWMKGAKQYEDFIAFIDDCK